MEDNTAITLFLIGFSLFALFYIVPMVLFLLWFGAIRLLATFFGVANVFGLAAYIACWIFFFPFMLAACLITGALCSTILRSEDPWGDQLNP